MSRFTVEWKAPRHTRASAAPAPGGTTTIASLAILGLLLGCSDAGEAPAGEFGWAGSIDSIGGRVVVRNPREPLRGAGRAWEVAPDLRIGALEGGGPEVFGAISAIAVSSSGDIAVIDGQALELRVFDRDGRHLWTAGRRGEGPGEFQRPVAVQFDSRGRVWVTDVGNARYDVFGADGEFERSAPRLLGGFVFGSRGAMTAQDELIDLSLVVEPRSIGTLPIRIATDPWTVDTLPPLPGRALPSSPVPAALAPFMTGTVAAFDDRGDTWFAQTDAFRIYRRTPNGDTVRVVEWTAASRRFADWEEDSISRVIRDWPHPVDRGALRIAPQLVRSLHVDDAGRLYVRRVPVDPAGATVFEAFDSIGRYSGPVHSALAFAGHPAPLFRGGAVYGVTDDELGVPYLVRGRIEPRGRSNRGASRGERP